MRKTIKSILRRITDIRDFKDLYEGKDRVVVDRSVFLVQRVVRGHQGRKRAYKRMSVVYRKILHPALPSAGKPVFFYVRNIPGLLSEPEQRFGYATFRRPRPLKYMPRALWDLPTRPADIRRLREFERRKAEEQFILERFEAACEQRFAPFPQILDLIRNGGKPQEYYIMRQHYHQMRSWWKKAKRSRKWVEQARAMFLLLDTSNSGRLDFEDFRSIFEMARVPANDASIRAAFDMLIAAHQAMIRLSLTAEQRVFYLPFNEFYSRQKERLDAVSPFPPFFRQGIVSTVLAGLGCIPKKDPFRREEELAALSPYGLIPRQTWSRVLTGPDARRILERIGEGGQEPRPDEAPAPTSVDVHTFTAWLRPRTVASQRVRARIRNVERALTMERRMAVGTLRCYLVLQLHSHVPLHLMMHNTRRCAIEAHDAGLKMQPLKPYPLSCFRYPMPGVSMQKRKKQGKSH